jgi:hypothetical protein
VDSNKLLKARLREYDVPSWPGETPFARVLVYRIPDEAAASETFVPGGVIVKAETKRDVDIARSPRGIIVSAGLEAMDIMHDHGMALGDLVWIAPHSPYRFDFGKDEKGRSIEFYFLYVGDICLDEDVSARLADGTIKLATNTDGKHVYDWAGEMRITHKHGEPYSKKRKDTIQSADSI